VKTGAGTETGDLSSPAVTTKSDKQAAGNENPIVGKLRDQNGSGRERTNANPTGRDLTPAGRRPTPGKNSANPNENNANDGNYVDQVAGSTNQDASTSGNGIRKPGSEISPDAQYSKVNGPGSLAKGNISVQADVRSKWPASPETQVKAAVKDPKSPHKHSLYVGILGAPDLSTIDFQKIKSVGTTYGILGGYTFNQTWSLETGVYLDKKKYFTDGQYFSKKNVPALQYIELQNVDGTCNMVEIPLNLRYNLSQGKQHKFFATAGLSTYLMSKEWYAYQVWTSSGPANKPFTYTNPYHYLFSIVNMSIGYEQKLGKIGDLRIEPYLRIPLSGIGTGSLSILSAGLNLGITRRIW